ncbi:MAG: TonB-dependent receptor, partial [Acidobacteriota bacterium]|nr:TonB-dependent receptor [Acidobacteriota bacterium]
MSRPLTPFSLFRFALVLAAVAPLAAQTEVAQLAGTVRTAAGAPADSALVEISSALTGFTSKVNTSRRGVYIFAELLPGEYVVRVTITGFTPVEKIVALPAGMRIGQDFTLGGNPKAEHLEDQTVSRIFSGTEIRELPSLTRNPYQFAGLAGNVSDAGLGTRGVGLAINGQREASTNILLDGANNNDEFYGRIGQQIPLDAVREFSVLTSSFTAEFGRASGGIVNVVSRAGSNDWHGSGWEFNRVSALTSNSFQDNATGVHEADFARNQFGYTLSGPVLHDKLFFFSSTEGTLVHGTSSAYAWVPTAQLLAASAPATQTFFQALGQLRAGVRTLGTASANDLTAIYGRNPCTGLACATLSPTLPLFTHVAYDAPVDGGGGFPQSTGNTFGRLDYNLSERTRIYARYALYRESDDQGVLSSSPYSNYDLGQSFFNQSFVASATHMFSARLTAQSKVALSRLSDSQQGLTSRGVVPTMYANPISPVAIGNDNVAFPGYNPFTPGGSGAFGGPQNILQFYHDVSWTRGSHSFRFGGSYQYMRDNRTDAAYQTAVDSLSQGGGLGPAVNGLLSGQFAQISVAVNPQGKFPCGTAPVSAGCSIALPAGPPNFSRSNRYHDYAMYVQDAWKITPRITLNLGLRWEVFGTQHNKNGNLDSNYYLGSGSTIQQQIASGGLQNAPN